MLSLIFNPHLQWIQRQNGLIGRWRQLNIIYGQSKEIRFGQLHVLHRTKWFLYDKRACFKRWVLAATLSWYSLALLMVFIGCVFFLPLSLFVFTESLAELYHGRATVACNSDLFLLIILLIGCLLPACLINDSCWPQWITATPSE